MGQHVHHENAKGETEHDDDQHTISDPLSNRRGLLLDLGIVIVNEARIDASVPS